MDGVQSIAAEASKDPNTLVLFMAAGCVAMCALVLLKLIEMNGTRKRFKDNEDVPHADIKKAVYECSEKNMSAISNLQADARWLREVHDAKDGNGRFLWWGDPELKPALRELTEATKEHTRVCTVMCERMGEFVNKADKVLYQGNSRNG